jgi:hypothetical protein
MGKTSDMLLISAVGCTAWCLLLAVPTLHYASDWSKGMALVDACILGIVWLMTIMSFCRSDDIAGIIVMITAGTAAIVKMVLWILGIIVVVSPSNNQCAKDGNPMFIAAIFNFLFTAVTVACISH